MRIKMIAVAIVVGNIIVEVRSYLVGFPQAHFVLLFADTEHWGTFRLMSALPSKADIRIGSAYRLSIVEDPRYLCVRMGKIQ